MAVREKIKVLICDDSALVRQILQSIFADARDIEVVGTASNPKIARAKIKEFNPDVLTLDIEMPEMDGLSFLEKIMTLRPMPVVMISSLTTKGSAQSLRALELGVVDVIAKPVDGLMDNFPAMASEILDKVRAAASAKVTPLSTERLTKNSTVHAASSMELIAIGASTGGVQAIKQILPFLNGAFPPVLITQHMPGGFTAAFAERMNKICQIKVMEASSRIKLRPGMAVIAEGNQHMTVRRALGQLEVMNTNGPPVGGHRPSVDVLFDSVAKVVAGKAVGVLLTGMGRDGASGLLNMRRAGAHTIGQDEASCTVFGMPRVAQDVGAVEKVVPLSRVVSALERACWPAQTSGAVRSHEVGRKIGGSA